MGSTFLCRLLTHSNIKMKTVILAVVVITIWCSLSVVQSRPQVLEETVVEESQKQKNKKNIVEKADLDNYSASSKIVNRINVPDDGPGAAYGYVANVPVPVVHAAAAAEPY